MPLVPRFLRRDASKSLALECVLQVLGFPYIQSEMAENAPTIVMSFVGRWREARAQAKIVAEFSDVVTRFQQRMR